MSKKIDDRIRDMRTDPSILCTRAWTSLEERSLAGDYQICCFMSTILGVIRKNADTDIMSLWNNEVMTGLRQAFVDGTFSRVCPSNCPVLVKKRNFNPEYTDFYSYDPAEYESFSAEFRDNREKVLDSIVERALRVDTFPLRLKLHPTNICNLECRMCNLDKSLRQEIGDNYLRNIHKLLPYLEEIVVFGGEPFACKVTRDLVFGEEMRKYPQIHFSTISNGALLDERILEKLKRLRLGWFSFSLDSCEERTYPLIRVNSNFARTFANIERFVRARDAGDLRIRTISALFVIQKLNFPEIAGFVEWAHSLRIEPVFSFVDGTNELLGHIGEVRGSLEAGKAKAAQLGLDSTVTELNTLLRNLPSYQQRLKRQRLYFSIFKVVDRDRIVSFLQKHNRFKRTIRKIMGI
jgi:hypothetical protein